MGQCPAQARAESDRVTAERDIKFIDLALAVVLPVCLVRDPHAALEASVGNE
jgi:hypothetical protein